MVRTTVEKADRTFTYNNKTSRSYVQWSDPDGDNAIRLAIATAWTFTPDMSGFDVDRIDSGEPIFTPITDILGTFSIDIKNAVSLYDTSTTPANEALLSYIIKEMAEGNPPKLLFAPVMYAEEASANKFINLVFTGRVMSNPIIQVLDQGVQDVTISGEITNIATVQRSATPRVLG